MNVHDYLFIGFVLVGVYFLVKMASYIKAEEMLTMLKVSREMDFQYESIVRRCVKSSRTAKEAVTRLKNEVEGTILMIGGRNFEMDVEAEWRDK